MNNLTSAINVQVDANDKKQVTNILKDLGLNMSTLINMTLKQVIKRNGLPFEVRNPRPSKELLEALEESDTIEQEYKDGKRKGYNNIEDLKKALLDD